MIKRLLTLGLLAQLSTSCIHVASVSGGDLAESTGKRVMSEASGMGFLSLTAPSQKELEAKAVAGLARKGATKNVVTRLSVRDFFIVQMYSVNASGQK